jgi:hypothetical protein
MAGCAGANQPSSADEVKAFFKAGNEAIFLGVKDFSPQPMDLSAYIHLMGVKYPPTQTVEVLSDPPQRPYQVFAVLEGSGPGAATGEAAIERFKGMGREIGADAIVLCGSKKVQGLVDLPVSSDSKAKALAIKYRNQL